MAQDVKNRIRFSRLGATKSTIYNLQSTIKAAQPDYWLIAIVVMLVVLGTVMVYSASFVTAEFASGNPAYYLWRHLVGLGLGLIGCTAASLIDYHRLRRFSIAGMLIVLGLLLAVLMLPKELSPSRYGAKRWISPLGDESLLQFQPSELAKVMLILYAAHWLSSKGDKIRNFYYGLVPFALTLGALIALVMGEPDLGTSLVIGTIGLSMFFIAGSNVLHLLAGVGTAAAAFYVLSTAASYRLDRLKAFQNPFADTTGVSWHSQQNLISLGSGGLFGTGLGASREKFFWLPNVFTDSIFAVIGEELGLIGAGMVVLLFLALGWRGMQIAAHAPDGFGRLIAAGVTIYIVCQAFLNIAVISSLVPFTGVPLPLISYGSTSLAVTMTALGLLLNVSRQRVADPQLLLVEEQRAVERQQRELLREQRQADRERREAQRKLVEAERIERERQEMTQASQRWHARRAQQQAADYWQERAQQSSRRHSQTQATQVHLRQADPAEQEQLTATGRDLPPVATQSFLSYHKETTGEVELDGTENSKPRLRKPRRDWAKAYEARRNRED